MIPRAWLIGAGAAAGVSVMAGVYIKGRIDGRDLERATIAAASVAQIVQTNEAVAGLVHDLNVAQAAETAATEELAELERERAVHPAADRCFLETQEDVDAFNGR